MLSRAPPDRLVLLLCAFHHTLIHDHGYRVTRNSDGFTFRRPDLTSIPPAGPPTTGNAEELLARHTRERLADDWTITPLLGLCRSVRALRGSLHEG